MPLKLIIKPRCSLTMKVQSGRFVREDREIYSGDYQVIPDLTAAFVLETKDKLMAENILISAVPQCIILNDAGGETLMIGKGVLADGD